MKKILSLLLIITTTATYGSEVMHNRLQDIAEEHAEDVIKAFSKGEDSFHLFFKKLHITVQNQPQKEGRENKSRPASCIPLNPTDSALKTAQNVFNTFNEPEKKQLFAFFFSSIKKSLTPKEAFNFSRSYRPLTPHL